MTTEREITGAVNGDVRVERGLNYKGERCIKVVCVDGNNSTSVVLNEYAADKLRGELFAALTVGWPLLEVPASGA